MTTERSIRCVCFDYGGVILKIHRDWHSAAARAGVTDLPATFPTEFFLKFELMEPYQLGQVSTEDFFESFSRYLGGVSPKTAARIYNGILDSNYSGVPELMDQLKAKGLHIGLLSNTNPIHWDFVEEHDLSPALTRVDTMILSHIVGLQKPDQAIYRSFEEASGFDPASILYFDDHLPNVEGAKLRGWSARLIDHEGDTSKQMLAALEEMGVL